MPKTNSTVNTVTLCFINRHIRRKRWVTAYMLYTCTKGSQQFSSLEKCNGVITVFNNMYNGKGIQKKKGKRQNQWSLFIFPLNFLPDFLTSRMSTMELPQARYLLQVPCMFSQSDNSQINYHHQYNEIFYITFTLTKKIHHQNEVKLYFSCNY